MQANVLTGAINMGVDTMAVGRVGAAAWMGGYMLVVCGAAVCLDTLDVRIKFC
jgi:hypothetical protein